MDPNETLRLFRQHYAEYLRLDAECQELDDNPSKLGDVRDAMTDELESAAEYAHSLDEWLSNGGFLPERWVGPRL
ncbi:MAG: hypothetical protein ACREP9_06665 [Candidatus Dormibacteraceae bacterium]